MGVRQIMELVRDLQHKMKSTKVQTLGELRMRDTANWWAGLLVVYMRLLVVSR